MKTADYGDVATAFESRKALQTMFLEVQEYFEVGASLSPGATVVDVGANIGAFAIASAKRCGGALRTLCFEPVPRLFCALQRNLKENQWLSGGHHRAFDVALTSPDEATGSGEFFYFRRFPRDSTMDIEHKRQEFERFFAVQGARAARRMPWLGGTLERAVRALPQGRMGRWVSDRVAGLERIRVACGTLSGALSRDDVRCIDLLKIDVEGSEIKVLAGIEPALWSAIQQMVIESDGAAQTTRSLVALLESRQFGCVRVAPSLILERRGLPNVLIYASK